MENSVFAPEGKADCAGPLDHPLERIKIRWHENGTVTIKFKTQPIEIVATYLRSQDPTITVGPGRR